MDATCTLECEHVDRPPVPLFDGLNRFGATATSNVPAYLGAVQSCTAGCIDSGNGLTTLHHSDAQQRVQHTIGSRVVPSYHPPPLVNGHRSTCAPPCHTATRYCGAVPRGYCADTPFFVQRGVHGNERANECRYQCG